MLCSDSTLGSRDVDDDDATLYPPYVEYMAVAQDSVHHQAIRV